MLLFAVLYSFLQEKTNVLSNRYTQENLRNDRRKREGISIEQSVR